MPIKGDGPRPGSKAEKVLKWKEKHPDKPTSWIAKKANCALSYAAKAIRKYWEPSTFEGVRPMKPASTVKKKKKTVKKAKKSTEETPPKDPGKLPQPEFKDGEMRGGNGRVDYNLKVAANPDGIRKHEGPVSGLDNTTMNFTIVDGDAAANVREAEAYVDSIEEVLKGMEMAKKGFSEMPDNLSVGALQINNILNAGKRIADKLFEMAKKRDKDSRENPRTKHRYKVKTEFRATDDAVEEDAKNKEAVTN